jgi:GNAT superfamily N-acetyltransferase
LIHIRDAGPADIDRIVTYNLGLAKESESRALDREVVYDGITRALQKPEYCRYFLAEMYGLPVGQIMLTYEWSDWGNGLIWWIQSVYVEPEYRQQGIFRAMFEYLEHLAEQDDDVIALRLYVDQDNQKAMNAYEHLGMYRMEYRMYEKVLKPRQTINQ